MDPVGSNWTPCPAPVSASQTKLYSLHQYRIRIRPTAAADTMQCSRQDLLKLIEVIDLYRMCRIGISPLYAIAFYC